MTEGLLSPLALLDIAFQVLFLAFLTRSLRSLPIIGARFNERDQPMNLPQADGRRQSSDQWFFA